MAQCSVQHCESQRDFVGHVGGDDFVLVFQSDDWERRCEAIVDGFNAKAALLYDEMGRANGGIEAEDRHGVRRFFSFTTLSIGAVRVRRGQFRAAEFVANAAAEAKHGAKMANVGLLVMQGGD